MAVDINLHNVTNVVVKQFSHDYENGDRWFVTKEIIIIDEEGNESLKLQLFGKNFNDLRFQSQAEYDGIIEPQISMEV
jgi:hypothetical protein|tara:strand:- start:667 stop:900 length:234 start_codon:yes stop_codon:yes gene_type:complete